jgi:hypothetical protein
VHLPAKSQSLPEQVKVLVVAMPNCWLPKAPQSWSMISENQPTQLLRRLLRTVGEQSHSVEV